ncbi:MAG: type II secretion system F family protein, partial [Actinomycetota bacterium]
AWGWVVFNTSLLALICGVAAGIGMKQVLARHAPSGRGPSAERLREQLPEALSVQTCALRAGQSMIGALKMVASEIAAPLGEAVALVVREVEFGTSLEQALEDLALRAEGREIRLWVTAMLVHRQTGGDLARLLDAVADRLRQADQLRRELRALSAQGRLSGLVMALAPLAFFALVSVTAREQVRPIVSTLPGVLMLLAGLILDLAGFLWIRRILRIRV